MKLRKEYEKLINDLRENPDEILRGDNINYSRYDTMLIIDIYKNYHGILFTLEGNASYDISILPRRSVITVIKANVKTGFPVKEDYPMPDDIIEIIYNYGKRWMYY